jgi:hypothetical protein
MASGQLSTALLVAGTPSPRDAVRVHEVQSGLTAADTVADPYWTGGIVQAAEVQETETGGIDAE